MNDIEQLKMIDLENQLKFSREKVKMLKNEVTRLKQLLNGENIIENSLTSHSSAFDHLKSSHKHK